MMQPEHIERELKLLSKDNQQLRFAIRILWTFSAAVAGAALLPIIALISLMQQSHQNVSPELLLIGMGMSGFLAASAGKATFDALNRRKQS